MVPVMLEIAPPPDTPQCFQLQMDFGAQLTQFQQEMHFNSSGAGRRGFGVFLSVKTTRITIFML